MFELAEHARIALEHARDEFLKSLRGRSDRYDKIREMADRFMHATGAPDGVRPPLEGVLILHLQSILEETDASERAAVKVAIEGERARVRAAMLKLLEAMT